MPIFEYRCEEGHSFDLLLSHAQAANDCPMPCRSCDKYAERVMSPSNLQFKGTWFKTKGTY